MFTGFAITMGILGEIEWFNAPLTHALWCIPAMIGTCVCAVIGGAIPVEIEIVEDGE